MRVFTCSNFTGKFPVGTAAVMVADNQEHAAGLLNVALREKGLEGDAEPSDCVEIDTIRPKAVILRDGDY